MTQKNIQLTIEARIVDGDNVSNPVTFERVLIKESTPEHLFLKMSEHLSRKMFEAYRYALRKAENEVWESPVREARELATAQREFGFGDSKEGGAGQGDTKAEGS